MKTQQYFLVHLHTVFQGAWHVGIRALWGLYHLLQDFLLFLLLKIVFYDSLDVWACYHAAMWVMDKLQACEFPKMYVIDTE